MVNGENLVFARREKWQLKGATGLGRLNDWWNGKVFGEGENSGIKRRIVG